MRRPSGIAAGDVLLAGVVVRVADRQRITPPAGWRMVRSDRRGRRERLTQAVYLKVARAGEPATYTWSFASRTAAAGGILAYRGVDAANPVDAHSGCATVASRSRIAAPSLTTSVPNVRIVSFFGMREAMRTAPPAGTTERFDAVSRGGGRATAAAADFLKASAGATGAMVAKATPMRRSPNRRVGGSRSAGAIGQQVALRSAAADVAVLPPPDVVPPLPDLLPPDTTITSGPSGTSASRSASFGFSSPDAGATFQCRLDGGSWGACSSPKEYSGLADGAHTFDVRALDAAGNADGSPATRTWVVAGAPPPPGGANLPPPLAESTGTVFHVATNGSNSNPGTQAQPWLTVQKALTLQPGQKALVHGGTYTQALDLTRACTAANPCTVEAAPGEARPVLRITSDHVLRAETSAAYWRIRGFTFRDSNITSGGLVDLYGHHLEFSNNELTASGDQDFYLDEASRNIQILGDWMHDSGLR